jgi:hypothetical protein
VCQTPTRCCGPLVSVEPRAPRRSAPRKASLFARPYPLRPEPLHQYWLGVASRTTSRRHKARSLITWLYVSATKSANRLIERYCLEELVLSPHEPEFLVLGSP